MKAVIIIPAYNPTKELVKIVKNLIEADQNRILVVDDGSKKDTLIYFDMIKELGIPVIQHEKNFGKGHALKTGIRNIQKIYPDVSCVITADSDGQHIVADICNIARTSEENPDKITLGSRELKKHGIPLRSRFGNTFSKIYFRFLTGVYCPDTQTGLRGIPKQFLEFATSIPGERYDYEMNFLIEAAREKIPFKKIPIEVILFPQK